MLDRVSRSRCGNLVLGTEALDSSSSLPVSTETQMPGILVVDDESIKGCPAIRMRTSKRREVLEIEADRHWLRVTVDPLLYSEGYLYGAVHAIRDITELKLARRWSPTPGNA